MTISATGSRSRGGARPFSMPNPIPSVLRHTMSRTIQARISAKPVTAYWPPYDGGNECRTSPRAESAEQGPRDVQPEHREAGVPDEVVGRDRDVRDEALARGAVDEDDAEGEPGREPDDQPRPEPVAPAWRRCGSSPPPRSSASAPTLGGLAASYMAFQTARAVSRPESGWDGVRPRVETASRTCAVRPARRGAAAAAGRRPSRGRRSGRRGCR